MKKLLADLFPENKDRQDFFIALVVIALFITGLFSYILSNRNNAEPELLTAEEVDKKVQELEFQQLSFEEGIVTDIDGYRPYYDHRQKEIIYNNRQVKTDLTATAAIAPPIPDIITDTKKPVIGLEKNGIGEKKVEVAPEAKIIIEEDFDRSAIQEEVPPELDDEGNVIENGNNVEEMEKYDAEAIEAERERKRLVAAAKAEKETLARAEAKRKAAERAKRNSVGTLTGCHIIVGAFKSKKNAHSFKDKVAAKNFTVAVGSVRGKMYVGIPVTCADKDKIKASQQRVNSAFEINSWVLRN